MRARRVRLVTVRAGDVAVDLAVAADAPVTHLVPVLGTALGLARDAGTRHTVWAFREERWRPLQVNRTLDDAGIVDGEVLHLAEQAPVHLASAPAGPPTSSTPDSPTVPSPTSQEDQ